MSDRTAEQIRGLLITAAGSADVVRLASLIHGFVAAGAETFTRPCLADLWSQRWRHHLTMPSRYRPEQRISRSLPNLIGVGAVSGLREPDMRVLDGDVLWFLAGRVYMAEALDVQHPTSNTLPVSQAARESATALLAAARSTPADATTTGSTSGPAAASAGNPAQ